MRAGTSDIINFWNFWSSWPISHKTLILLFWVDRVHLGSWSRLPLLKATQWMGSVPARKSSICWICHLRWDLLSSFRMCSWVSLSILFTWTRYCISWKIVSCPTYYVLIIIITPKSLYSSLSYHWTKLLMSIGIHFKLPPVTQIMILVWRSAHEPPKLFAFSTVHFYYWKCCLKYKW